MTFCLNDKSGLGAMDATTGNPLSQIWQKEACLREGRLSSSKIRSYTYKSRAKKWSGLVLSFSFSLRPLILLPGIFYVNLYYSPFSWDQLCLLFCTCRTITTHTQTLECLYPQLKCLTKADWHLTPDSNILKKKKVWHGPARSKVVWMVLKYLLVKE